MIPQQVSDRWQSVRSTTISYYTDFGKFRIKVLELQIPILSFKFAPQDVNLVAKLAELGFGQFESELGDFESDHLVQNSTQNQNQKRLAERVLR